MSKSGSLLILAGGFRRKIMQPSHEVRGCLPKSICIHHLIFLSKEPCERNAISTHFIVMETDGMCGPRDRMRVC